MLHKVLLLVAAVILGGSRAEDPSAVAEPAPAAAPSSGAEHSPDPSVQVFAWRDMSPLTPEQDAALRRVLSEEGMLEFRALRQRGFELRAAGDYEGSTEYFKKALELYTSALAAPYIRYSSYTHLGEDLVHKYAKESGATENTDRGVTDSEQRMSFLELERKKASQVHSALREFARTLAHPHVRVQ